ncbi:hypothetical protein ACFSE1_08130 [Rhizobium helianthi]|uniref:M23 family peptidase n=1 Tax=Rhizobium helianthi TaxID=1132695 RepID=A0ABW4M2S2_9HYPH
MPETHDTDRTFERLLTSYRVAEPDAVLMGRILNLGAQQAARRTRRRHWMIGAGLVSLGLAGGLSGAVTVAIITPIEPYVRADQETAFGLVQGESEASRLQEEQ